MNKKILLGLLSIVTLFTYAQPGVKIYKDLYEGMSKKEAKRVMRSNKSEYVTVDMGNVEWTIRNNSLVFTPKNPQI